MTLPPTGSGSQDENESKEFCGPQLSKSQESCRSESQTSSQNSNLEICRICHCEGDSDCGLIAPCYCSGSLRYVHQSCLQQWIKSSNIRCCELCKFQFIMQTKTKPFMEWEPLEMTGFERRKLLCAVMFHAIALTCVVWSLYVLIHRTAEEIQHGLLEWPFWTKLIVVAIGFTGGVVFMYIQCKAYMQICQRWKAFNRVIYVQNAPEKQLLASHTPPLSVAVTDGGTSSSGQQRPLPESKSKYSDSGSNYKDETSIDLKGVRNLHIFFNDESSVRVENDQDERDGGTLEAVTVAPGCNQRSEDGSSTSWHIKIGKSSTGNENCTLNSPRCFEADRKSTTSDNVDSSRGSKPNEEPLPSKCSNDSSTSNSNKNDSVLKLQIKKSEIVIKFGQKANNNATGELKTSEESPSNDRKDTSVNIKIDNDEENDHPIVIDVVKKAQPEVIKDPVEIRFDFCPNDDDRLCDKDEGSTTATSKLIPSPYCDNSNSETDSASHSPLLLNKSYSSDGTSQF